MDWSSRENSPEGAARPLRLVGLGHSHLTGLEHAAGCRPDEPGRTVFQFLQMLEPRFHPNLAEEAPAPRLHPSLVATLDAALADGAGPVIFAAISGNEHHVFGMVNHPRPFDFALRERPDLPLTPGAEIVPAGLLAASLTAMTRQARLQLAALRGITDMPVLCVSSPPPVPDNAVVARQETMFSEAIGRLGVAPPALRWKLWRLQTRVFEEACAETGVTFLHPPAEAVDGDGFLRPEAWHGDCVHANIWYGERVLRQIETFAQTGRIA